MYRAALFSRWLDRLDSFVKRAGNKTFTTTTADRYLRRLVGEVPALDAKLAYEEGGLCNIIDSGEFAAIFTHFESIERVAKGYFNHILVQDISITRSVNYFKHLRTVCLIFRDLRNYRQTS